MTQPNQTAAAEQNEEFQSPEEVNRIGDLANLEAANERLEAEHDRGQLENYMSKALRSSPEIQSEHSNLDFEKPPEAQLGEYNEFSINIGILIAQNTYQTPEQFLANAGKIKTDDPELRESLLDLQRAHAAQRNSPLGEVIRRDFPSFFVLAQNTRDLLSRIQEDPRALPDITKTGKETFGKLEKSVEEKGIMGAAGEFLSEHKGKIGAALIVGAGLLVIKSLFGGEEENTEGGKKEGSSSGMFGPIFKWLGIGGLGAAVIAGFFGNKDAIKNFIAKQVGLDNFPDWLVPPEMKAAVEEAKKMKEGASAAKETAEAGQEKAGSTLEQAKREMKEAWEGSEGQPGKKAEVRQSLIDDAGMTPEGADRFLDADILEVMKDAKIGIQEFWSSIHNNVAWEFAGTTVAFAFFKRQLPVFFSTLRHLPFGFLTRSPILAALSIIVQKAFGVDLGSEYLGKELERLTGPSHQRELLAEEQTFLRRIAPELGIPEEDLLELARFRVVDLLQEGENMFVAYGHEALKGMFRVDIFERADHFQSFATLYDLLMSENVRASLDHTFLDAPNTRLTVSTLLAQLYDEEEVAEQGEKQDNLYDPGHIEVGWETGEWGVHVMTQELIETLSANEIAKREMERWDQEHPGMRGSWRRLGKTLEIGGKHFDWDLGIAGTMMVISTGWDIIAFPFQAYAEIGLDFASGSWEEIPLDIAQMVGGLAATGAAVGSVSAAARLQNPLRGGAKGMAAWTMKGTIPIRLLGSIMLETARGTFAPSRAGSRMGFKIRKHTLELIQMKNDMGWLGQNLWEEVFVRAEYERNMSQLDHYRGESNWDEKRSSLNPFRKNEDYYRKAAEEIFKRNRVLMEKHTHFFPHTHPLWNDNFTDLWNKYKAGEVDLPDWGKPKGKLRQGIDRVKAAGAEKLRAAGAALDQKTAGLRNAVRSGKQIAIDKAREEYDAAKGKLKEQAKKIPVPDLKAGKYGSMASVSLKGGVLVLLTVDGARLLDYFTSDEFSKAEKWNTAGDIALDMFPVSGTLRDGGRAWDAAKEGEWGDAAKSAAFSGVGLVSDALLGLSFFTFGTTGVAGGWLRGALSSAKGFATARRAKIAAAAGGGLMVADALGSMAWAAISEKEETKLGEQDDLPREVAPVMP